MSSIIQIDIEKHFVLSSVVENIRIYDKTAVKSNRTTMPRNIGHNRSKVQLPASRATPLVARRIDFNAIDDEIMEKLGLVCKGNSSVVTSNRRQQDENQIKRIVTQHSINSKLSHSKMGETEGTA